jgi:outer membrane biosynthesis protein TonB
VTFAIDNIDGALPDRKQVNRIAAGIALSVLAHALLLAFYRQPATTVPAAPPERLTIRLHAAPPPPAPPVEVNPAEEPPRPIPRAQPPARKTRPVIAVPVEKRQSTEETYAVKPAPETPAPPPEPAPTRHFDVDAARSMARGMATKLANEPDPDKVGTALERLPKPALQTENKFERAIKQAKRPDCKDGVPGGLLAPIFLAMDKKDSGCKW